MKSIRSLMEAKSELTHGSRSTRAIVLSTRVRLARNLAQYPFPEWAKESQRREILASCLKAVNALPQMNKSNEYLVEDLSNLEKQILMERHLISREMMQSKKSAGVVISGDQSCAIMLNEEDHLRIQIVRSGYKLKEIWKSINAIDNALEATIDYAFLPDLGYLTACPTNVGTGIRASAMLHLPGLVMANQMEKVVRAVNKLGIAVRGLFGEGSDASGSIFQISNQQTLGESEEEILKRLVNVLDSIIEQEENARQKILETDPTKFFDKIGRAYGILSYGHVLSSAEVMNLLSLMRLAVDLRLLPEGTRRLIDRALIESQPGHVQFAAREKIDPAKRDKFRARYLREHFAGLPALNFDNLMN